MDFPKILTLILSALPLTMTFAEDPVPGSEFSLSTAGTHEVLYALPAGDESWATGYSGAMKQPRVENTFTVEASQGDLKAVLGGEATVTALGTSVLWSENYLSWTPDAFRFTLGNQIFAWGTADGKNPTDNLNPRDFTSVAGQKVRKLPILSASASWYPTEELSLQAVFVPVAGTSLYPSDTAASLRSRGLSVTVADPVYGPGSSVAGGRASYRSTAFDASVSYLYDIDSMVTPTVADNFSIALERKRIQRFGADFKTTVDRFGLWAEGCWSLTGNSDAGNYGERLSHGDGTLGLDFSWGPGDAGYTNLQYAVTWVPGYDASANSYSPYDKRYLQRALAYSLGGIQEEWLHSAIVSTHWNLADETVVPSLSASYSLPVNYDTSAKTRYGSLLVKPELEFTPADSFHITVGAALAWAWKKDAGQDSLSLDTTDGTGVYTPQNNVFVAVKYQWISK